MADKKISALTAATTPLAGTEVLPIVQSGATVKVAVSNLTAGRDVSATSIATGLGAAGTPAYTFTGDTNTGMWSPGADTIAFSEGGVEAMRITSAGDVGIGTTSPAGGGGGTTVHIAGASASSLRVSGGADALDLFVVGSTAYIQTASAFPIFFRTNGVERMTLASAGNVGINETVPDYQLDVNGTFGFTPGASVTPVDNGDVVFELTNNTTLTVKAKGSDGTVRSGTIVLA
jgi:hypothetical protein